VPDRDNGEALLKQAIAWYDEHLDPTRPYVSPSEEYWEGDDLTQIKEWIATGDSFVAMVAQAVAKPSLHLAVDWEKGVDAELLIVPWTHRVARFLDYRVRFAERATPEVVHELAVLLDFAAKLGRSCTWDAFMRWQGESVAADALEELARKPGFDAREVRAELDGRFVRVDDPSLPCDVLRNNRVFWLSLSRRWTAGESPARIFGDADEGGGFRNWLLWSCVSRPFAYRDALRLLDITEQGIHLAGETPREALPKASRLMKEFPVPFHLVCNQASDDPFFVIEKHLRHQAVMRVARVGLAVLELRQETGRWPDSLDAVVPMVGAETIIDPYNGDRLQYEPGVRVEALAPNPNRLEYKEVVWRLPE
jgi:hypothetical protein